MGKRMSVTARDEAGAEAAGMGRVAPCAAAPAEAVEPLLEVTSLDFAYDGAPDVLSDVSFSVQPGELVTLLGPNGAGKSTLLNVIVGLLEPHEGEVLLDGAPLSSYSRREIARRIAYVPQSTSVAFSYSVRDYAALGRAPYLRICESPGKDDWLLVDEALERLGVSHLASRAYCELSGGQRQLVDIARALVQTPRLILFDEPTSALDYGNQVKVLSIVSELSRQGYSIIMTTHNPDHPILLDSSVCLLDREGRLVKGGVSDIMEEGLLREVYGCALIIRYSEDARRFVCMTPAFS